MVEGRFEHLRSGRAQDRRAKMAWQESALWSREASGRCGSEQMFVRDRQRQPGVAYLTSSLLEYRGYESSGITRISCYWPSFLSL